MARKLAGATLAAAYEAARATIGHPATCTHNGNGTYRVVPHGLDEGTRGPNCGPYSISAEDARRLVDRYRTAPRPPAWVAMIDADPA